MTTSDSGANVSRRTVLKGISGAMAAGVASEATIGTAAAAGEPVALQYFCEDWTTIADDMKRVSEFGFDTIWIQAPQKSRLDYDHPIYQGRGNPPLGYQPMDLRVFDSVLGTEEELKALIDTAHSHDVSVYIDTVMNHMAAGQDPKYEFPQFSYQDFHHDSDPDEETREIYGMPDLRQSSSYVRGELYDYMKKIADLGADGYRFDAVKNIPEYFWRDYANPWADNFNMSRVGEVFDTSVEYLQNYADTGMRLFDYPLFFTIEQTFAHGDMRNLEGAGLVAQDPGHAMPFVENHDVNAPEQYTLAHAFVLTIEGYPMVYNLYPDWILENDDIRNMIWVRKNLAGGATTWLHTDPDLAVYEREGNLLVGINNSDTAANQRVKTSWTNTDLHDYSGNAGPVTTDANGWVHLTVPPEGWTFYAPPGEGDSGSHIADGKTYVIRNVNSGKVLDVAGVSEDNGADVHQWEYLGGENQHWTVEDAGNGYYQLVANHSNKVLDVASVSSQNGGNVHQWDDYDTENQEWMIEKTDIGYRVVAHHSGKALDVKGFSTDNGATVHQWDWAETDNQRWTFEEVNDGGREGQITLKIKAPTAPDESVFFTGSIDDLTNWGGGLEGKFVDGYWQVTLHNPGDFEWKARRGPAGQKEAGDVWEAGDNHTSDEPVPTHNGWHESDDTLLQIEAPTALGEAVYFTGSAEGLTNWGGGIQGANIDGVWQTITHASGDFEWKTRRGDYGVTKTGDVWEVGDNHTSTETFPTHNGWEDGFTNEEETEDENWWWDP